MKESMKDKRNELLGTSKPEDPLVEVFLVPAEDVKADKWPDIFLTAVRLLILKLRNIM